MKRWTKKLPHTSSHSADWVRVIGGGNSPRRLSKKSGRNYGKVDKNLIAYAYDALGRRILENPNSPRTLYYSSSWQVLEEDVSGKAQDQNVWSAVYIDALVERDRDPNNSGVLSERFYVQLDANRNVTAIINTTGAVQERYAYDPYGSPTFLDPSWTRLLFLPDVWRPRRMLG